ncbi:MAG: helix-turn-helix transcriptional regulator [Sandaracinus sp.]|nr:helix-turn-helix transcriptional regulator [Sandaracinus sp.]
MTLRFHFLRDLRGVHLLADGVELGAPVEAPGPYTTSYDEVYLVEEGEAAFRRHPEFWCSVSRGTVVFGRAHVVKQWRSMETLRGVVLVWDGGFFESFLKDPLFPYSLPFLRPDAAPCLPCPRVVELATRVRSLMALRGDWREESRHRAQALVYDVLSLLVEVYDQAHPQPEPLPAPVRAFLARVDRDHAVEHRVESYADHMGVSRVHLARLTKRFLGRSPSDVIKDRLLAEAKLRILGTGQTLEQIAASLGFRDARELHRFFRTRSGVTPGAMRRFHQSP